jgi:CheY-like chemotaxis protein
MKEKILVADDMAMDREVLTELLQGEFEVTAVENGLEAVRKLDENPGGYACVLLDIFMPEMDGFAILAHMRETGDATPVIALTSLAESEGRVRCYEAGVRELLEKPYDRRILLYKVRRMVAQEKPKAKDEVGGAAVAPTQPSAVRFNMLFGAFREDFGRTLAQLRKAISEHDEAGLRAASHALGGIEANLGVLTESLG